jgi:hypothetical protein
MEAEGVSVSEAAGYGRVLVTRRAYLPWELLLSELPLLRWRNVSGKEGLAELAEAFCAAPADVQASVLKLQHPPLDGNSPRVVERRELAKEHGKEACPQLSTAQLHKLLLIADTNAHSFYGDLQLGGGAVAHGVSQSALFSLASKAAHCCAPNAAFSTKVGGAIRYFALRPIAQGEQVTISYLADVHRLSRLERRTRLLDTKNFWCTCSRCAGPDDCAALRCCACGGVAAHSSAGASEANPLDGWSCCDCCAPQQPAWLLLMNDVLSAHDARLSRLRSALYCSPVPGGPHESAAALRRLVEAARRDLCPCHARALSPSERREMGADDTPARQLYRAH